MRVTNLKKLYISLQSKKRELVYDSDLSNICQDRKLINKMILKFLLKANLDSKFNLKIQLY